MVLEQLHTDNEDSEGAHNKIMVKFTAILLDVGETLSGASASISDQR